MYHCTIDLRFDCFGISCMTTDNFCFYLQNRLIQTSQTGGQWYSDTSPFSTPWQGNRLSISCSRVRIERKRDKKKFYNIVCRPSFCIWRPSTTVTEDKRDRRLSTNFGPRKGAGRFPYFTAPPSLILSGAGKW
jgi:hypothetical protein